ncbi:hypothetical protein MOC02_07760 [Bacillus inaquosorum]|uniref:hypothetical protein n=1 Tax=Bacillus TaxID=1386 RepID=UPI00227EE472|nr:hypothetical protein [Bacillus inaquosorum]MCY9377223.1 hypothetical protein [Bacillus sp. T17B1]MCY8083194.1 hypothetical protein [Bacillus inaquosorum]MCY8169537.1 hypothetical protein [Bacillus inaquosorum]MCY8174918.1 hypothetical protein [Bacillus inaquosorum]MCY8358519.1 hypothetical protein [Bacillus inaquosorum]
MKEIVRDIVIDDIDVVEGILDKLYVYLENTLRPEENQIWKRCDKDIMTAFVKLRNIKETI